MFKLVLRILGTVAATVSLAAAGYAKAPGPLESQSFQIGTVGALCEAQEVRLGNARASVFDRKWALICRDVSQPIGAAYSWRGGGDLQDRVTRSRTTPIECGPLKATAGGSGISVRSCSDSSTGLEWRSYTTTGNGWSHVVEGFAAYDSALRLALANLVENRVVPGTVDVVSTGGATSMAQARAAIGDTGLMIGQGYRQNNAGEFAEAEEYFRQDALVGDGFPADEDVALATRRHEALVNRALQLSNLGSYGEAGSFFAQARAMGLRDPVQSRLLRNFEAIDALNRGHAGEVLAILARPVPDLSSPVEASGGAVAIVALIAASLNSGQVAGLTDAVAQEARLTTHERTEIIDAQAGQLAGTVLRLTGRSQEALAQFTAARDRIRAVKQGRVLSTARLQAQIMSEMALANEALGRNGEAEQLLRASLDLTEQRYPESASVKGAQARLAAFLSRRGDRAESMALYRQIVGSTIGQRTALVGIEHQIEPYFHMLVEELPGHPDLLPDLFLAAQMIEKPGAARTLSLLSRQLEGGSSEASELFRRATNVERELNRINLQLAQSDTAASDAQATGPDPAAVALLVEQRERLQQSQLELIDALSAFPAYRSLSHNYVTADHLRADLKPGEAYLKLIQLGDAMYAVYVSPDKSTGWRVSADAGKVADLVTVLRDSISVAIGGVNVTYPFDVDSSRELYRALFGPVSADLARLDHLIFEPAGAMLQLPVNLLITDQAGVDTYHRRVDAGEDEFDFRGIAWLGRDKATSTALSPASFRDARKAPASRAGKAYLGLGQNQAVGSVSRASLVEPVADQVAPGCEIPLAAWNRPIPADELRLANGIFGPARSDLIIGAAFTDSAIQQRSDLDQYRIVHFATHGIVTAPQPGCAARPALLTSFGGDGSDGLLQFVDIFDLKLDADLVILSACDTASLASLEATREAGLEGGGGQALDGLVRAFIGAGGRQVIASHWPAPEEFGATRRLFESFFESAPGTSVADALLQAERKLMDDPETSHPFYWSGFALIGDGERPLFPQS